MEWEQDISMFDWFFTPNNTSSKVIAITIGTIKYCYNIFLINPINFTKQFMKSMESIKKKTFVLFLFDGMVSWSWVELLVCCLHWLISSIIMRHKRLYVFSPVQLQPNSNETFQLIKLLQLNNFIPFNYIHCSNYINFP